MKLDELGLRLPSMVIRMTAYFRKGPNVYRIEFETVYKVGVIARRVVGIFSCDS